MVRVNIYLAMAKRGIRTVDQVHQGTGISRTTLSHLINEKATGIQFRTLDSLCSFFQCGIDELIERIPSTEQVSFVSG